MTLFIAYGVHKHAMHYMPLNAVGFYHSGARVRVIDVNGTDDSDTHETPREYGDFRLITPEQMIAELNARTPPKSNEDDWR